MILITVLTIMIALAQSCKTPIIGESNKKDFQTQLTLFQNGNKTTIDQASKTIGIERDEFSLRFYNKKYDTENKMFYAARIAAFTDISEFDKIKLGMLKSEIPYFKTGSGMAPDRSGMYEALILKNSGHHYLPYENSESKRVNFLNEVNDLARLEFEIKSIYHENVEVKMANTTLNEFYLVFLIDKNLNGIIEEGEMNKITIKIK
ncbi:MAG: hypothetical protein LAT68_06680 [Cyclobacteriaceae bacterium]|nr:hypothetical protein [Cyclobacteriaceae bacterium]MCH8515997.1 hypothetical protein [Cyclobacteriaceae bacterium]